MKVGIVEWRMVVGARERGTVQLGRDFNVEMMERGGCADGVSISLVLAMSKGASIVPAIPAAETATARDDSGNAEERISNPPVYVPGPDGVRLKERPGSGRAKTAEMTDRRKELTVARRME